MILSILFARFFFFTTYLIFFQNGRSGLIYAADEELAKPNYLPAVSRSSKILANFINHHQNDDIMLYWIDAASLQRNALGNIKPGDRLSFKTFINHTFYAESVNDKEHWAVLPTVTAITDDKTDYVYFPGKRYTTLVYQPVANATIITKTFLVKFRNLLPHAVAFYHENEDQVRLVEHINEPEERLLRHLLLPSIPAIPVGKGGAGAEGLLSNSDNKRPGFYLLYPGEERIIHTLEGAVYVVMKHHPSEQQQQQQQQNDDKKKNSNVKEIGRFSITKDQGLYLIYEHISQVHDDYLLLRREQEDLDNYYQNIHYSSSTSKKKITKSSSGGLTGGSSSGSGSSLGAVGSGGEGGVSLHQLGKLEDRLAQETNQRLWLGYHYYRTPSMVGGRLRMRKPVSHFMWSAEYIGQQYLLEEMITEHYWTCIGRASLCHVPPPSSHLPVSEVTATSSNNTAITVATNTTADYNQTANSTATAGGEDDSNNSSHSHPSTAANNTTNTAIPAKYLPIKMQVLSTSPRIFLIENFLSESEVLAILALAAPGLQEYHHPSPPPPTSSSSSPPRPPPPAAKHRQALVDHTESDILQSIYLRAGQLMNVTLTEENTEPLQVNNYLRGYEYPPHYDFDITSSYPVSRSITLLMYLTDMFSKDAGGETAFFKANHGRVGFKIHPGRGSALLFYNLLEDGNYDDRTLHASLPLLLGEKWTANLWVKDLNQGRQ